MMSFELLKAWLTLLICVPLLGLILYGIVSYVREGIVAERRRREAIELYDEEEG